MANKKEKRERGMPIMRAHAAGMDIGAEEIYVAIPSDHDEQPVRCFSTFTCDLYALADWLQHCGIVPPFGSDERKVGPAHWRERVWNSDR